jgi:hypothetical protein
MTQQAPQLTISDLTLDEVNTILVSLQELPAKVCNPLTEKIRAQCMQQLEAAKAVVETQE